ncbi:hypothetical protein [Streptomyces sp. OE57]|uniref:hypothetical protein n=1 Tax=Streptomyces lacaronensis TaxID=3379885 RepID=UPI0039B741B7
MVELVRVVKSRTVYRRSGEEDLVVAIDAAVDAGIFTTVEIMGEDRDEEADRLNQVEKERGLDAFDVVTLPYRDLVMRAPSAERS